MANRRTAPIGKKYNRLTILEEVESKLFIYGGKRTTTRFVKCKCDCGKIIVTRLIMVWNNKAKSCGCLTRENDKANLAHSTHKLSSHRLYNVYHKMIVRCTYSNDPAYKNYGGRGIKVCKKWKNSFLDFYDWAIENGYKEGLEIDRIHNDKGYNPNNCRFITKAEQARNRRTNKCFYINGVRYLQVDLAKMSNVNPKTIEYHLKKGETAKEILHHFKVKI